MTVDVVEHGAEPHTSPRRRIGATAVLTGVSERTLRYYEEIGILVPAAYSPGGCREYGDDEVARVRRIRELQDVMGLNLDEIRELLTREDRTADLRRAWEADDDPEHRRAIVDEAQESTRALRDRLAAKLDRLESFLSELDTRLVYLEEVRAGLDAAEKAATS